MAFVDNEDTALPEQAAITQKAGTNAYIKSEQTDMEVHATATVFFNSEHNIIDITSALTVE